MTRSSVNIMPLSCTETNHARFDLCQALLTLGVFPQDEALNWQAAYKQRPPTEAIVFIIGGSTYEEAKAIADWNTKLQQQSNMRVLLGGSDVLNSGDFLTALGLGGSTTADSLR